MSAPGCHASAPTNPSHTIPRNATPGMQLIRGTNAFGAWYGTHHTHPTCTDATALWCMQDKNTWERKNTKLLPRGVRSQKGKKSEASSKFGPAAHTHARKHIPHTQLLQQTHTLLALPSRPQEGRLQPAARNAGCQARSRPLSSHVRRAIIRNCLMDASQLRQQPGPPPTAQQAAATSRRNEVQPLSGVGRSLEGQC